ncbi:nascent polypeptide-associated complex protein [Vulcanisaeta distributa]|uniref:nascent polypeptide-associated complex protein n=1 Tax=Vulcanisaeta distributa TaxID=164451 RepID=UPI0006D1AD5A|nr:nascent polypeptide-associated complex protein [Vulcanisaeta distributa]
MGINPREVRRLLRRFGIQDLNLEEVNNVTKVVIYLGDGSTIEINKPVVARMKIQGLSIYQVQASDSDVKVVKSQPAVPQPRQSLIIQQPPQQAATVKTPPPQYEPSEDDIKLVMEETGCTREEAIRALKETNGDIAEAIIKVQSQKGTK